MEKIPCIKCTPELWKYVQPYLEGWNYYATSIGKVFSEKYPILCLNWNRDISCYGFGIMSFVSGVNGELVTNVEEFLERAAKLKGFTYKRRDVMEINGIEVKAGMGIYLTDRSADNLYIVFPIKDGLGVISYGKKCWWEELNKFLELYSSDIVSIDSSINDTKLWEKPKEVVLTMQEIADKLGIPVEQLRIKK